MADLNSLMQIAPTQGSFMLGQQFSSEQASAAQKRMELQQLMQQRQQQAEFEQQQNPLNLEKLRLQNQGLQAGLPGITADVEGKQLDLQRKRGTIKSDIEAANAENDDKLNKIKFDQVKRARQAFEEMIPELQMAPVPLQRQVLRQKLKDAGMNVDAPHLAALDQAAGTPMFNQYLKTLMDKLGEQAMALNPGARATIESAKIHAGGQTEAANIHAGATIKAAKIGAESRQAIAAGKSGANEILTNVISGKVPPERALTMATMNSMLAAQNGDTAKQQFWDNFAGTVEHIMANIAQYKGVGNLSIGEDGRLTPKTVTPVNPDPKAGGKPYKGTGTAQDPIILK